MYSNTLRKECVPVKVLLNQENALPLVADYNEVRLNGAIGSIAPADKTAGRDRAIFAERKRKQEAPRERRRAAREASRPAN